jgi:hypothetical protein
MDELDGIQLIVEKAVLEQHIRLRKFQADAFEYMEASKNAEAMMQPYLARIIHESQTRSWDSLHNVLY